MLVVVYHMVALLWTADYLFVQCLCFFVVGYIYEKDRTSIVLRISVYEPIFILSRVNLLLLPWSVNFVYQSVIDFHAMMA